VPIWGVDLGARAALHRGNTVEAMADCNVQHCPRQFPSLDPSALEGAHPSRVAVLGLAGSAPPLGRARPMDVLALKGAAPVIRAVEGIAASVFA